MSFQGLISGSECAVPANPLSQVLKHTESDRSLQHVSQFSSIPRFHSTLLAAGPGSRPIDSESEYLFELYE